MTSANMKTLAGGMACESVRVAEAIVRKIMDMVIVQVKANNWYKKKGPTSRRRLDMKYNVRLTASEVMILAGRSQIILATASENG